eukprot:bmy_22705T0
MEREVRLDGSSSVLQSTGASLRPGRPPEAPHASLSWPCLGLVAALSPSLAAGTEARGFLQRADAGACTHAPVARCLQSTLFMGFVIENIVSLDSLG